ncbi:MAG: MauE/DoxX family redox-associated membrane protein, partial [bacterium]
MSFPSLATALVAFVFLLSAIGKGMDFFRAEREVETFILLWIGKENFLITTLARLVTGSVILAELLIAFMLVLSPNRKKTKLFAVTLLTLFIILTTLTNIVHHPSITCPCFGVLGKLPLGLTSLLDLVLLFLVIFFISPKPLLILNQLEKLMVISGVLGAFIIINLPIISPTPTVSVGKFIYQNGINESLKPSLEDG